jgi:catechol 2,3-dioxygenase-like lactoylglutathione lyase family enzyme
VAGPCIPGETYPVANHIGINHLAFRVSDIEATIAALRERGITFLSEEPQSIGPVRTILATDPDGVFVQLLEWMERP